MASEVTDKDLPVQNKVLRQVHRKFEAKQRLFFKVASEVNHCFDLPHIVSLDSLLSETVPLRKHYLIFAFS